MAQYFAVKPYLRHHPGHQVVARFEPAKESFTVGEELKVKMTIRNVGTNAVSFRRGEHRETFRQYSFLVSKDGKSVAGRTDLMGGGGFELYGHIPPGGEFVDEVDLKYWYDLRMGGNYSVRGFYYLLLLQGGQCVWTDVVSDGFEIEITKR